MKQLTPRELLNIWERGIGQTLIEKTLYLLSQVYPDMDPDTIGKLSIGDRDARLLLLRKMLFGSRLLNMIDCPQCSERCEWELNIDDILYKPIQANEPFKEFSLEVDEFYIRFRLPNSNDVLDVIDNEKEMTNPRKFITNCILELLKNGETNRVQDIPDRVIQALNNRIEEEEPQADIRMAITCPHCTHKWEAPFDIASYFWNEINNWAKCILQEVYALAKSFGWSEHEILNLSNIRRQIYLGMVYK